MRDKIVFAWKLDFFRKIRSFKDGISFFEFNINLDLFKGDHNPKFEILVIILNFKLIEFNFYNTEHYFDEDWKD